MTTFRQLRKESADVSSMSHRRLSTILKDPQHPHHSAAKAEMDRRAMKSEGYGPGKKKTDEGAMKRMVTTQSNKADRMASTDKKGLETYKKKVDEISLDSLTKKISNTGMSSTKKAMGADKTKKDLEDMKARLATEASSTKLSNYMRASAADVAKSRGDAKRQDKRIAGQKMADEKIRKKQGYSSTAKVAAEETVNEISMTKLRNYSKAASKDIEQKRDTVRNAMSTGKKKDYDDAQKAVSGLGRRSKGSDMYTDKMTGRSKVKPKMEGKAYGPTGVSYYVPSGHKDEVDPKTGKKYPERQKPGYKAPTNEEKDTHVTKDGRTVKKGLWYYMNKRKKAGTSRPKSAGTVDPKMMKKSQS